MTTTSQPDATRASGASGALGDRRVRVGLAVIAGVGILSVAVSPQLTARLTGREYELRVAPFDPVDPFRGAYVALAYPDLPAPNLDNESTGGTIYLPLQRSGDVWHGGTPVRKTPSGPYLRCQDQGWRYDCGIDSWFMPEGAAAATGKALAEKRAIAVVKIDGRGHAALVDLRIGS